MALSSAERSVRYRQKHPKRSRESAATWRARNPSYGPLWYLANRGRILERRYGITVDQYRSLLEKQQNRCANPGCRASFGRTKPCIDHCHATKKVRGLLCHNCNTALGFARDSSRVLLGLVKYLGPQAQTSAIQRRAAA